MKQKEKLMEEKHKTFFHAGDMVMLKGFENEPNAQNFKMKVEELIWKKNNNGTTYFRDGKKQLEGIHVYWINEKGDMVRQMLDSRSIFKVEQQGVYHLHEAKKWFFSQGLTEYVKEINEILDKC